MHKIFVIIAFLFFITGLAFANVPTTLNFDAQNAGILRLQGKSRLTVMLWDVYDIKLFTSQGSFSFNNPFALKITYLREIKGNDIANSTIEEIRRQGFSDEIKLAGWHTQLKKIFPNVKKGTVLIGLYTFDGKTIFLENDKEIGFVEDKEFAKYFFNIWLGEKTKFPNIRSGLLGEK